ncbi:YqcC family protein [Erwiniaceae bacterium BAC15a-03b]|uniref:YqcC family protein n=1 Tax=Winslowiella arboricola TaxID=2978220 RepID=A0A9J6PKL9_9GAMM|nr:YqcC family protein [Winslowiella arboricola]MCU5774676.1 YqcC family protein [Winslowiella arboricola]MCU5777914.1 YqcC family protein [Winslowiella arboricola]
MSLEQQVRQRLLDVAQVMHDNDLWQGHAPDTAAFNSTEPFCVDTMLPLEWLQWVLLPRMQALLDSHAPLPKNFAVAPYYEEALEASVSGRLLLLSQLKALDDLFTDSAN